ncbi:MotA/TolQ/ExbB proton channel family protein [Methyloradius palustris]|uniref:Biopolymer transporter ExbB n=1 Tax=Methyloradius palustris TaxID=2778876 RepID=A0A8D5G6V2_9PROT|nr:MotA/TolQ/ExbB proton channel family protein [Methyloradius palustris]BCM24336.1 biopolymer transporter ExbB [Methyloradius palustris]
MLNVSSSTSLVVQGVLWTLVIFSVVTWTLLLVKGIQNLRASNQNKKYKAAFWSASSLLAASEVTEFNGPTSRVATAGFNALRDADNHESHDLEHSGDRQDLLERTLRQQIQKERRSLETGLAILASIGSTSPFVGLFGTVWGIMHALTDISKLGSASLEVVAGPIGEALIATGFGIAVAVPAVLAYNFFLRRLKTTTGDLDDFAADLINLSRKVSFRGKTESISSKAANSDAHGSHANNPSSVVNLKKEAYA